MKYEIAKEFGIPFGPDATSRQNGIISAEVTKRLLTSARKKG